MTRYLFTIWDGGGNVPPELTLAKKLGKRGHSVRVLGDPTIEPEARAAGCAFSPWTTAPHRKARGREHDLIRDYENVGMMQMIRQYMDEFLGGPAPRWVADTCAVLDAEPADVVVTDFALPSPLIAAEARGLKTAVLTPNIWILPTPGIPPMGPGNMPATNVFTQARDALMRWGMRLAYDKALPPINATRASLGLPPVKSTHEQMVRADRVLVLTSPVFDFTSPHQPAHLRYTGPELEDPAWCEPFRSPWPEDDPRPLVAVGLSSTFQDQVPVLRTIVEALATLDARVLMTLGGAVDLSEVPEAGSVKVVRSAPHGPLFLEAAVVLTHCGHGTAMKALAAGKPIVAMPMGRDQNDTAARIVHAGAGVRLDPKAPAKAIRDAVERMLREPSFREGARRLATAIETREGCTDAVAELEELGPRAPARRSAHDGLEHRDRVFQGDAIVG